MMSYSDYDSEDYSSNEDEDYVPSDDNLSEDDMNECVREDGLGDEDQSKPQAGHVKKKKKRDSKGITMRKRRKGGLQLEEGAEQREEEKQSDDLLAKAEDPSSVLKDEQQYKKKADDLWASFLSDVGPRPKAAPASCAEQQGTCATSPKAPSEAAQEAQRPDRKPSESSTVTITKVFDFAGEEVRVTKEVSADSREAKAFLRKEQSEEKDEEKTVSSSSRPDQPAHGPGPSLKRPAGMGNILNRLGAKKQKMSTLEKSKLDWDIFKGEEGISDELAIHNRGKEGFVERKNFLERVDKRQFELEKSVRLNNMKR